MLMKNSYITPNQVNGMSLGDLRIAYLCPEGGPHLAHKPWIQNLSEFAVVTVIHVPHNILRRIFPSYILVNERYDLTIADGFSTLPIGWLMKKARLTKKLAFITTSPALIRFPRFSLTLLKNVDLVIATSSLMFHVVRSLSFERQIIICHPIPELSDFLKIEPSLNSNRICFVGSQVYLKGVDLLPEIIAKVRRKIKEAEVFVIGKGGMIRESEGVRVFGYIPHEKRLSLLSKCLIYLHPARFEAFGSSVVEAMAAGLIPIVTEMTGSKDLVKRVDPSLIVPLDVDAISMKIVKVLSMDIREKEVLSRRAKKVAEEWSAKTKKIFIRGVAKVLQ